MKSRIIDCFYGLLLPPLLLIIIIVKIFKNPKYLNRLSERFAFFNWDNGSIDVWLHTVSVGEFISIKPLLEELIVARPNFKILITTTTLTASDLLAKYISGLDKDTKDNIYQLYFPYDNRLVVANFLNKVQPKVAVFFETEIWPKLFKQLKKAGVKLYIINARLSEKSYLNYKKIRSYIKTILSNVDFIAAQADADKERFIKLGCKPKMVSTYGNIKYNIKLPKDLDLVSSDYYRLLYLQDKLVFIAASTHPGEEEIIINIYQRLKTQFKNLVLFIVPRHPDRFEEVYNLCLSNNLNTFRYTQLDRLDKSEKLNTSVANFDVFLLDTMGKLLYFYKISHLAFVGGSLVPIGGHNPIEPAILNLPVIIGPNYYNFTAIISDLQKAGNLVMVNNELELEHNIANLLADKELMRKMAFAGQDVIYNNKNILKNYLDLILN